MKQGQRILAAALCAALLFLSVFLIYGAADGSPDLSGLFGPFVLEQDRRLFVHPDGDLILVSRSEEETIVAQMRSLDGTGRAAWYESAPFSYRHASYTGRRVFLAGPDAETGDTSIFLLDLDSRDFSFYVLEDTDCDFDRVCFLDEKGRLHLVTVPRGNQIDDATPVSVYWENTAENRLELADTHPQQDPESSQSPTHSSSEESTESTPPSSSGSLPSSSEPPPETSATESQPPNGDPVLSSYFTFARGTTVFDLERELLAGHAPGAFLRVTDPNGRYVTSGHIRTGFAVEVITRDGLESRVVAVVLGDVTGTGSGGVKRLYEYLTGQSDLDGAYYLAADLTDDGEITTADLLELKRLVQKKD